MRTRTIKHKLSELKVTREYSTYYLAVTPTDFCTIGVYFGDFTEIPEGTEMYRFSKYDDKEVSLEVLRKELDNLKFEVTTTDFVSGEDETIYTINGKDLQIVKIRAKNEYAVEETA